MALEFNKYLCSVLFATSAPLDNEEVCRRPLNRRQIRVMPR